MGAGASSSKKNLLEPGGSARDPSQREGTHSASEGSASRNSEHKGDGSEQGRPPAYKSEAAIQGGSAGKFAADTPAGPGNAGTAVMIHGRAIGTPADGMQHKRTLPSGKDADSVWDWQPDDPSGQNAARAEGEVSEVDELLNEVLTRARKRKLDLRKCFADAASQKGRGGEAILTQEDFLDALASVLPDKRGLIDRFGGYLFRALDEGGRGLVVAALAADAMGVDSRTNPLRDKARRIAGAARAHAGGGGGGGGGGSSSGARPDTGATGKSSRGTTSSGQSVQAWTVGELDEKLALAETKVKKLKAVSKLAGEDWDEKRAHLLMATEKYQEARKNVMAYEGEEESQKQQLERALDRASREADEAEEKHRTAQDLAKGSAAALRDGEAWVMWLSLEGEEARITGECRHHNVQQLQELLAVRDHNLAALWHVIPRTWDQLQAARQSGGGAEAEAMVGAMLEMNRRRREMAPLWELLLVHVTAERDGLAERLLRHAGAEARMSRLERKVKELEEEKAELTEEGRKWKGEARRLEEALAVKEEEGGVLEGRVAKLDKELAESRETAAQAGVAKQAAEAQQAMAIEKLNHVAAEVSRVNEDNVTLRAQAHGAVKQAKEARQLLEEVEALRQKEERKWLQAQEEETKRQASQLSTKIQDFRAAKTSRGPMGPRVFWSSSVSDFTKEREEVKARALPALQEVCGRRGLVLTVVDLRCGYADSDAAVGRVMPMLLEEIDLCTYFSCFLGQQYGCYPQNMRQVAGANAAKGQARVFYEASATALEAAYVLEHKLTWGRRAFFYVRDPRSVDHVQARVEVPMTPEMEEAQQALISQVSASGLKLTLNYRSAEDGVAAWRSDLEMAVEADYPLPPHFHHVPNSVDGWRPASYLELLEDGSHAAAFETRLARHVSTASLSAVVAALHDHVTRQEGTPILLTGPPGCGKTTALAVFLDQYKREVVDSGTEPRALIAGLSTRAVHTTPVNLLRSLMRRIKLHFMIDSPALPEAAADILSHGTLFSWLELGALEAPVLFGLDLDGFVPFDHSQHPEEEAEANGMAWLSSAQPLGANLVVATSQPAAVRTVTERFFWPTVTMELLERKDTESIVEQYLGSRGITLEGRAHEQLWQLRQEELSSPLFLSLLLLEWQMLDLVGWKHDAHIARMLVIRSPLPDKACALLFNLMLDRWEEEYETGSRQIFGELFGFLVLARAGLSWEELLGLTGIDPSVLGVFFHKARDLLGNKTGRYFVQHQVVAQVLHHRYLNGTVEVGAVRATLVDFFRAQGFGSRRACLELPYQHYQQNQTEELRNTIEVLGVFNAFFSSGLEPELLHYWSLFHSDTEAKPMAQVYQKALNSLEQAAAEGLSSEQQLQRYGVSLDSLATMASVLSQLGRFLARSGQNLASIQVLERLVQVYSQLKPNSIELASAAQRVAAACFRIGFFDQGLPCAEKCLEIHLHVSGPDSIQVADAMQVQALLCLGLNQLEKAADQMQASLKVREAVLGRDHPSVAEALLHASKIALRQGSAEEAKDLQLRANKLMGARARKATRTR